MFLISPCVCLPAALPTCCQCGLQPLCPEPVPSHFPRCNTTLTLNTKCREYALLVSRALALTRSAKSTSPVHPAVLRLGTAAAACAGVAPPSPGTPPSQYGKTQQPAAAAGATAPQRRVYNVTSWSELATRRYGKRFEAFAGLCWPALCAAPSAPLSAELLELCSASLDAMASGAVGHTAADLEFWCSALQVAASCAPRVMAPLNWAVGGGQWQALGAAGPQATLLMEALESSMGNSCGVVPPKPDTALPPEGADTK